MKKINLIIVLILSLVLFSSCSNSNQNSDLKTEKNNSYEVANPASTYCIDHGGKLEFKKDNNGGTYGVCNFENGKSCEEWAFYRGECSK